MNVLIFVMTMLMLLSLLTYARFETYRSSQVFQVFFNHYMEKEERGYINIAAEKEYKRTKGSEKNGAKNSAKKIDATPRISLILLVDKKQREAKAKEWDQTRILIKNLMTVLYSHQKFFEEAIQTRPMLLDELLGSIVQAVDALPEGKQKFDNVAALANLKLSDEKLDQLLFLMLDGAAYQEVIKVNVEGAHEGSSADNASKGELAQEFEQDAQEADEYKSPKGYYSLLDFVNLSPHVKVRVFLASREVLEAIFMDKIVVDEVIAQRKLLYKQVMADVDPEGLSQSFKNQFDARRDPSIDSSMLEFAISKTNPKTYE